MKKKEIYLPPTIEVTRVVLEQGIAAASVAPGSGEDDVQHEWDQGDDQDFEFEWDYQP